MSSTPTPEQQAALLAAGISPAPVEFVEFEEDDGSPVASCGCGGVCNFYAAQPPTHAACGNEVTAQWDTQADEPFWHCYECDESFTIGGDPASHFTAIPEEA